MFDNGSKVLHKGAQALGVSGVKDLVEGAVTQDPAKQTMGIAKGVATSMMNGVSQAMAPKTEEERRQQKELEAQQKQKKLEAKKQQKEKEELAKKQQEAEAKRIQAEQREIQATALLSDPQLKEELDNAKTVGEKNEILAKYQAKKLQNQRFEDMNVPPWRDYISYS